MGYRERLNLGLELSCWHVILADLSLESGSVGNRVSESIAKLKSRSERKGWLGEAGGRGDFERLILACWHLGLAKACWLFGISRD